MNDLKATAALLYRLQTELTYFHMLFEGKWWTNLMKRIGVDTLLGMIHHSHNELVQLRSLGVNFDYRPYYSKWKVHRMFEDPLHSCHDCKTTVRMIPTAKNRILKYLKVGKYKNANFLLVD